MEITLLVGPGRQIIAQALELAAKSVRDMAFVSFRDKLPHFDHLPLPAGHNAALTLSGMIDTIEHRNKRTFHTLVTGNFDARELKELSMYTKMGIACIYCSGKMENNEHRQDLAIVPYVQELARKRPVNIISYSSHIRDQAVELVSIIPIREKLRTSLKHNLERDRQHEAYLFCRTAEQNRPGRKLAVHSPAPSAPSTAPAHAILHSAPTVHTVPSSEMLVTAP